MQADTRQMTKREKLPDIVVANQHFRFTGVSATVEALVPHMQEQRAIALLDLGGLDLPQTWTFRDILRQGWSRPEQGKTRIWHARRDVEMLTGLFLKWVLWQPWKVVFTSAAPKRHGAFLRWLINRMDAIIVTSQRSAEFLDWYSVIISHGVDTDIFVPPADKLEANETGGLPGKYAIGSFGRIRPSKGSDLFVEAMIELLPRYPEFSAFLTGLSTPAEQEFRADLERKIAEAGLGERIVFLGDLSGEEIRNWYRRCTICVAASRREGFGLTPMEAMASGAVAVCSGAGFWPELIRPGQNGALFETGNRASLVAALEPFMAEPLQTQALGEKARRYVVRHHSIRGEADQILDLYAALQNGDVPRTVSGKD